MKILALGKVPVLFERRSVLSEDITIFMQVANFLDPV